jgi:hypothetical protein
MAGPAPVRNLGALWTLLSDMRIEEPGARSFEQALAEEQGWSLARAGEVSAEYRRFLYLAATSPELVTPSVAVDRAWHLHLTYSRHYWEVLCREILGRPLHHDPGDGGEADAARHRAQYQATLRRYRETFGEPPPLSVWPRPDRPQAPRPERSQPKRPWRRLADSILAKALVAVMVLFAAAGAGGVIGIVLLCAAVGIAFSALFPTPASARDRNGSCGAGGGDDGCAGCGSSCGGGCGGGCG